MKKKIVAGALGIVIVAGVFGVGYFAGQAGGLKTADTSYSQSTSEKNESASSVIDVEDISQSTATTEVDGTPHSQSTAESMPSVTSAEDTQPRSRISNDINLTYSYDESTGVLSIDWDRLAKNEYIRLDTTMSYFSVMVKYSHIGDSDDFNISVNMHDLCHFIKDYCVNNIEECKNPGAYSIGVRCYKNINDVDDFYLLSFGNVGTPAPLEINWYDSKGKSIDISSTDIEHAMNHLELKLETQGSIKIEDVDIVSVQTI